MKLSRDLLVKPGKKMKLKAIRTDGTPGIKSKQEAETLLAANVSRIEELDYLLYAENRQSLLIVLQAMDAGGKDGVIRHVIRAFNPQGCLVKPFKVPTSEEHEHDFLWRIHQACPPKGGTSVFNRSQYEDVLVVRVRKLVSKSVWSQRYDQINAFERYLDGNSTRIIKFFLHISKDEQKRRLEARLADPKKNWKFSVADLEERKLWDAYQEAYEDVLAKCSTEWAPWFVVPADNKWYRNAAVSQIIVETLEDMNPKSPKPAVDLSKIVIE